MGQKIYTSTDYPASQWIELHNEMSYSHNWPGKIYFFCATAAEADPTPANNVDAAGNGGIAGVPNNAVPALDLRGLLMLALLLALAGGFALRRSA